MFLGAMLLPPKRVVWTSLNSVNMGVHYLFTWLYCIPFGGYTIPYKVTLGLFADFHYYIWFCLSTSLHRSLIISLAKFLSVELSQRVYLASEGLFIYVATLPPATGCYFYSHTRGIVYHFNFFLSLPMCYTYIQFNLNDLIIRKYCLIN